MKYQKQDNKVENKLNILLSEYNVLKSEQLERIKIRDTLIYISLGIFGAVFSFAMLKETGLNTEDKRVVFLLLPTISFVLSWIYIDNDSKISHIGEYIKEKLIPIFAVSKKNSGNDSNEDAVVIFGWETYHSKDDKKNARKFLQWMTDILTFIIPAIVSIYLYFQAPASNDYVIYFANWNVFITGLMFILLSCYNRDWCRFKFLTKQ